MTADYLLRAAELHCRGGINAIVSGMGVTRRTAHDYVHRARREGMLPPSTLRLTPEQIKRMLAMRIEGYDGAEIAAAIGCSIATVHRACRRHGHTHGPRTRIEAATLEGLLERHPDWSGVDLAEVLGVHPSSVHWRARRLGWRLDRASRRWVRA